MNQKEIKELIELLVEKDITEFVLERGDIKVHVKRGGPTAPVVHLAPAVSAVQPLPIAVTPPAPAGGSAPEAGGQTATPAAPAAPGASAEAPSDADLYIVKSPIVGTYYEAPSPGTPPFVKVGDTVKEGQVLCIIEAMKLMNEIEAEVSGVIAKMLVSNGSPVEYGMPLFGIRRQ
jgi:acetyl-CoA carboxylase biotin carboxyl carrier protein